MVKFTPIEAGTETALSLAPVPTGLGGIKLEIFSSLGVDTVPD